VRTVAADAPAGPATLAPAARSSLLHNHLAEIIAALSMATRVGERLLWGSLAESVAHIAIQLDGVDSARRALAVLGEPVAGLVEIRGERDAPSVSRRTCCLWFATDTGRDEYCAGCPVTR
jgi:ferric iron reductase protein FhuF